MRQAVRGCYNACMRVAINGFFWDQPHTGSGQYLHHLWAALHERKSQDHMSFTLLLPPTTEYRAPSTEYQVQGSTHSYKPKPKIHKPKLAKLWWEEWGVARAAEREDARLLHIPYLASPIVGRTPVVVTAHDMIPWVVPGYAGSPLFRIYMALAVVGARRARLIMADSEASRRDAIRVLRVPPHRVRTVYLGVEPPQTYTPQQLDDVRARYNLPPHFAFYIGGFDRRKNVPLLLRAWRDALETIAVGEETPVLAIAGNVPSPGGIFPDVRAEAGSLGFGSETGAARFLGRISEEDKPLLMAAALIFVYPSAYEGFGLDPLEAMSLGTPVVASWGGSLSEVVGEGGLLVPPDDEAALTNSIIRTWQDDDLCRSLSRRGRAHASSFTWERAAAATVRLYKQAMSRGGRG